MFNFLEDIIISNVYVSRDTWKINTLIDYLFLELMGITTESKRSVFKNGKQNLYATNDISSMYIKQNLIRRNKFVILEALQYFSL